MTRGREVAARHGIRLLMDDIITIDSTSFIGGPLWTDFRLGSFMLTQAMRTA